MTLSEAKAQIRYSRRLLREWRAAYHQATRGSGSAHRPKALNLSMADRDAMEWGLGNLQKAWIYDHDDNGDRIPGTGVLTRMRGCIFVATGTMDIMFMGLSVRIAEPVGFVWS